MKAFLVDVKIQTGEYEKNVQSLVFSETQEDAKKEALLGQCHGDIGNDSEWVEGGIADMHWEFHYSVSSFREVAPEDVGVLKKYFRF